MFFNLTSTEELISFMVEKQITPNQAAFCHLIYTQNFKELYRYVHEFQQFSSEEIADLEDRGLIINQDYHNKTVQADMYVVTDLLLSGLDLTDTSSGEEFWDNYPNFILVHNQPVPAKSTNKDELVKDYAKAVVGAKAHERVLSLLGYAKSNNMITMGIRKWVDSRQWNIVEEVKNLSPPTDGIHEREF